jgi:glycerate kinase
VVACDKFKGSLNAREVRDTAVGALRGTGLDVVGFLTADGGDGTLQALQNAGFALEPVQVEGPTGEPVTTAVARRHCDAAVELADACGAARLPGGHAAPLTATTQGLGTAIRAALAGIAGGRVRRLIIGAGGSASTDGGLGMLAGLGAVLRNSMGEELSPRLDSLGPGVRLDLTGLPDRLRLGTPDDSDACDVVLAADVTAPLLGPSGTVAVFGPQKGLTGADAVRREQQLEAWAGLVAEATGRDPRHQPGAGAAGGVGFAAMAVLGVKAESGVGLILELTGLRAALEQARLVVTGEGLLDGQTLLGKTVHGVAQAAAAAGVPAVAICGDNHLTLDEVRDLGLAQVYALTDLEPDRARSMAGAARLVAATCERIASNWRGTVL